MKTLSATAFKQNLWEVLTSVDEGPIQITKRNKIQAYVISLEDYQSMKRAEELEDRVLANMAIEARKEWYLSELESEGLLESMINV